MSTYFIIIPVVSKIIAKGHFERDLDIVLCVGQQSPEGSRCECSADGTVAPRRCECLDEILSILIFEYGHDFKYTIVYV